MNTVRPACKVRPKKIDHTSELTLHPGTLYSNQGMSMINFPTISVSIFTSASYGQNRELIPYYHDLCGFKQNIGGIWKYWLNYPHFPYQIWTKCYEIDHTSGLF